MKVVLSVRVGVSGVLCHLDSSSDTTGHDDGYFGLNVGHIYLVLICFIDVQRWHTIFIGRELLAQSAAVMWNELCY